MRFLVAAFGSRGDVQPMVALSLALRARGHQVTVCAPPDYLKWLGDLGLTGHAVGANMHEYVARTAAGLRGVLSAIREFPGMVGGQYAVLEPLARECDVMLGSTLTAAGASFAEKFSIRYHYVSFTPCVIPSAEYPSLFTKSQTLPRWVNRLSWWAAGLMNNLLLRPTLNAERRRLGLGPIGDTWLHMLHDRLIIASQDVLAPLPKDAPASVVQTGTWFLPEPEALSSDLEDFLEAGAPPVYIGFGSMPDRDAVKTTRWVLDAVRSARVRALISRGAAGLGEADLPPGVRLIGFAPHGKLFPRCAAIVHHGGAPDQPSFDFKTCGRHAA